MEHSFSNNFDTRLCHEKYCHHNVDFNQTGRKGRVGVVQRVVHWQQDVADNDQSQDEPVKEGVDHPIAKLVDHGFVSFLLLSLLLILFRFDELLSLDLMEHISSLDDISHFINWLHHLEAESAKL